jgi:transposase
MKALDRDLRERIVRAVERGESMPSVAARFEVSPSTVKKLKYRQRDTGSTEPETWRCGRKRALSPQQSDRLVVLMTEDSSRTLEWLRAELKVSCCLTAIWNELRRRRFSHKKSRSTRPSSTALMSPRVVRRGSESNGEIGEASSQNGSSSLTRRGRRPT